MMDGAVLLADAGRTCSSAARVAGYSDDRTFRGHLSSRTGRASRELRREDPVALVTEAFLELLRTQRNGNGKGHPTD